MQFLSYFSRLFLVKYVDINSKDVVGLIYNTLIILYNLWTQVVLCSMVEYVDPRDVKLNELEKVS